jgi:hypothetical protein
MLKDLPHKHQDILHMLKELVQQAIGDYSHTEGQSTITPGNYSHAEGESSITGITTAYYYRQKRSNRWTCYL